MTYKISNDCFGCDSCRPQCPTGAIQVDNKQYRIDSSLCNNCEGYYSEPQCVISCPLSIPVPSQAKKGRYKADIRTATSTDLFPDGKSNPLATAMVIWEACNLLTQRQSLCWKTDSSGKLVYQRQVNQGRGTIAFHISENLDSESRSKYLGAEKLPAVEAIDLRAACLHLIYAAHATALDKPWEQEFVISDRQIEDYLGLEKRKDLSKAAKLTLIKELAQQPCKIVTSIHWPQQGQVRGFSIQESRLWHLLKIEHYFQEDSIGCKHLVGLTFRIKAGKWAKYFLNKQGCKERTAFYQYGILPKAFLSTVMSIWQQHEGAARMLLWLLFKTKMGREQRIIVPTLMRVAYGEEKVVQASSQREERKRLLRTFENDLEVLSNHGLKPIFDPVTYVPEIQPLWAKLAELPDEAEEALDFWINDGSNDTRLTDSAPRGKWNLLMNARILWFELPAEWNQQLAEFEKKKQRIFKKKSKLKMYSELSGEEIMAMRKNQGWSQRELARMTGKSQSWIRDIENGRLRAKSEDLELLRKVLGLV